MKLTSSAVVSVLCWTARLSAAASAHVYIHDPESQPEHNVRSRSLEPVPARLVLAQRAGVLQYHGADLSRQDVIDSINDYGLSTPMFATERSKARNAFILLQQDDITAGSMPSLKHYSSFGLDPAPDAPAITGLFMDLFRQSDAAALADLSDDDVFELLKQSETASDKNMFYIAESPANFEALSLSLLGQKDWSVTALVTPATGKSKHQWGTYEMPGAQSPLKKRQQQEAPLTESTTYKPVESSTAPVSAFQANNTTPLRGIFPACFTSKAACEESTRNCTGHGSCIKKYHDSTATKAGIDCFVCACTATKSGDGKRTTQWGGPACQKKDVSVQFWLIVLFTVGLVFLIGFAVGTIWEMGSQELPSVIGAGVSGPSARR